MDPRPLLLLTNPQVTYLANSTLLTLSHSFSEFIDQYLSFTSLFWVQCAGSGLASVNKYHYGFFSAAIKLPPGDSSGVVVAFYVSTIYIYAYVILLLITKHVFI